MIYDQPFSGCDLAATYDLVDTIRTISRIQQSSAIMSLTQLSQEVFDLFDRIILLTDGHVLFQGPRQDAIPYFAKLGYIKPSYVESSEFLEDIAAGDGSQYIVPGATPLTLEELVECYRASDHYKDIMRIVNGDDAKHTYWVESEPGIGLSLKTPSKYHSTLELIQEFNRSSLFQQLLIANMISELVVSKLSTKVGHSGGIESTGRVLVGDVITAISMNDEEMQYLSVGSQIIKHNCASHAYAILKQARGHTCLQVERCKEQEEYQAQWKQFQRPFVQTWLQSTKTLTYRQIKITKRLHAIIKLMLFQAIMLRIFAGTLFYKLGGQYDQQQMNSVRALGFVSTMSIMLLNLVQLPLYMLQRPIFYKHRAQRFFRTSSYITAHSIVNLPQTLIEYLMLLFLVAYFGSSVFFFISAISSIQEVGNALAGLLVLVFQLFSGFVIFPSNIPTYWKWLVYLNPIHWANVSFCRLQFNEGYTEPCSKYHGELPFCDQSPSMTVRKAYMVFYELSQDAKIPWLPYVILLGWIGIANLLTVLRLKKIEFMGMSQSLPRLKKTPIIRKYEEDREKEFQSYNSNSQHLISQQEGMKDNGGRHGLGIPVKQATPLFEDLSFARYDEGAKEGTAVFNNITGYARPHTMLALLGGNQTSKVTLLKCLAGRIPASGSLNGNLQANGLGIGTTFSRLIGYVEKLDAHQPYLSIRESLQFSAALHLGQEISATSRRIHVELVLNQLGLLPYSNELVGHLRNATGKTFEIAKKITIAVELAANPSILLLEEPISGTLATLNILSQVSNSGRVIISTLTHPNARTLSFFDLALILTREGNQAYFGPVGSNCNDLLHYFTSIPKAPHYSRRDSLVRFIMGALGIGTKKRDTPSLNFSQIYQASSLCEMNNKEICNIKKSIKNIRRNYLSSTYPAPYSWQAILVILRTQRFLWRNVQYTYARLTGCVMIGLLMGSLYFQIEYKDIYGATSRTLYIYMQVILIGVISANNVIPQIGTDRLVYFREKRTGMYLPVFYPISWAVGEIPYFLMATLAVVGIGNGMAGIGTQSPSEFIKYRTVLFLFTLCLTYFGMMITFLAPVPTLAAFAMSIVTSLWVSASGVVVLLSDKGCGSQCNCPRLQDGSYVWDRLETLRSLSHERIDLDILILSAMCLLFASPASVFFVVLRHNSPPPI
ncbi:hypothetical protein ACJW31_03G010600 [Castanea mollissima]